MNKKILTTVIALTILLTLTVRAEDVLTDSSNEASKQVLLAIRVSGRAVTGSNRFLNKPIWNLGEALGESGFNFVFGYDPGKSEPSAITEESPMSTLMATGLDENYLALFGMTSADIDPALVNVPLHEVAVVAGPAGEMAALPSVSEVGATVRSRIASNAPVSLEKWLQAKGVAKFHCFSDGTSSVTIRLKGLIPDAIYSAWGVYSFDSDGDGLGDRVGGVPLGGVPNILVASEDGTAAFSRALNFCPAAEPRLKYLTVAFHSDANINGAVPDQALLGFPGGTLAHAALSFPINVIPAQQP